jgi:hypothetical protein
MLEGVIVITTFLVFFGLIMWSRNAYGLKLDMQQKTRSEVLYYASHGCEGGGGNGGSVPISNPGENGAQNGPADGAAQAVRSWNSASLDLSDTATGSASVDTNATGSIRLQKIGLSSNVTGTSNTVCNEPKYNSQLTAWFRFGVDLVRRGGGIADLF